MRNMETKAEHLIGKDASSVAVKALTEFCQHVDSIQASRSPVTEGVLLCQISALMSKTVKCSLPRRMLPSSCQRLRICETVRRRSPM